MPITSYQNVLDGPLLYEGQIKYTEDTIVRTGYNSETDAIIPFGRAVAKGAATTGSTSAKLDLINQADANSVIVGISVLTHTLMKITGTPGTDEGVSVVGGVMGWPVAYPVSYLVRGVIGVRVAEAVTPTSDVFAVHTASSGIVVGSFRTDNTNAVQIAGAKFLGYGAQDDIVPLSINLA
jgi:hypothetical protein